MPLLYQDDILSQIIPSVLHTKEGSKQEDSSAIVLGKGLGLLPVITSFLEICSTEKSLVFLLNANEREENLLFDNWKEAFDDRRSDSGKVVNRKSILSDEIQMDNNTFRFTILKTEITSADRVEIYKKGGIVSVTPRMLVVDLLLKRIPLWMITGFLILHAEQIKELSLEAFIIHIYRQENKDGFLRVFSETAEAFTLGFNRFSKFLKSLRMSQVHLYPRFHLLVQNSLSSSIHANEIRVALSPKMNKIQISIFNIMEACISEIIRCHPELDIDTMTVEHSLFKSFDINIQSQLDPIWHLVGSKTRRLLDDLKLLRKLLNYLLTYDCVTFYRFIESLMIAQSSLSEPSLWLLMDSANVILQVSRERVFNKNGEPCFEPNPKWKCLSDALEEILLEDQQPEAILIMVDSEKNIPQISEYLAFGSETLLQKRYKSYKSWKRVISKNQQSVLPAIEKNKWNLKKRNLEYIKKVLQEAAEPSSLLKRKRLDGTEAEPHHHGSDDEALETHGDIVDAIHPSSLDGKPFNVLDFPYIVIESYDSADHLELLKRHQPSYIIMYDSDISFIRAIEIYQANNDQQFENKNDLKVYLVIYKESVEEQRQLFHIRKEKEAFEKLIKEKSALSLIKENPSVKVEDDLETNVKRLSQSKILVDMREFRSSLPFALYKKDYDVIPVTLEVGDYILSPRICVERKTVSDLIGSFSSGRFTQVSSIVTHYPLPLLLIEFDPNKSFILQASGFNEISFNDLSSKLCLLLLNFPSLRLFWAPSQNTVCQLFSDLQRDEEPPDLEVAANVGIEKGTHHHLEYNLIPRALLSSIPGLLTSQHFAIYQSFSNMVELVNASLEDLSLKLGKTVGEKVFGFFNNSVSDS